MPPPILSKPVCWQSRMNTPQSESRCDGLSSIQASTSAQLLFSSQRSIEQPSQIFSSQPSFHSLRIAYARVISESPGALMTPPGIMKLECGHWPVSYTHLRAHETDSYLVCRL